jgi:hypothetical protein
MPKPLKHKNETAKEYDRNDENNVNAKCGVRLDQKIRGFHEEMREHPNREAKV